MKQILILALLTLVLFSEDVTVKITNDIPFIVTKDSGQQIKVERIQDTNNRLTDDYTKTSRACPPFCIQPTKVDADIKNIEEVEIISFMENQVENNTGVIIDARLKSWYELESIPSAINIPFPVLENASKAKAEKIFKILGMKIKNDGSWDFSKAKELAIFDNGLWCEQGKRFINGLIKHNYPKNKLLHYRSGFQGWKILGLTTIIRKEIKK